MTVACSWSDWIDPQGWAALTLCHVQPIQSTSVVRWNRFKSIIPDGINRLEPQASAGIG